MLIIIEGANGVGKTTLTMNLDYDYIHFPTGDNKCSESILNHHLYSDMSGKKFRSDPNHKHAQNFARLDILSNLAMLDDIAKNKIVISDRSLLSNLIYSGKSIQEFDILYEYLNTITCKIIFIILYANDHNILVNRISNRKKDDELTNKLMKRIKAETIMVNNMFRNYYFNKSLLTCDINIIKIPIDNLDENQLVEKIKSIIN